jgi:hypothetical protein
MNRFFSVAISVFLILPLLSCGTAGTPRQGDNPAQPQDQTQQQQPAQAAPVNWTGDGGKGMSLTIYAPQETGLEENQKYLTGVIQRELVNNFSDYSGIFNKE